MCEVLVLEKLLERALADNLPLPAIHSHVAEGSSTLLWCPELFQNKFEGGGA